MMSFKEYLNNGLVKPQKPNFKQIAMQIERAKKDLRTFYLVLDQDPEWASTMAYQAMLRAGRALIFAHGFLPADGQQHKTVVEMTGKILGSRFNGVTRRFDRFRKKRNIFFYDSADARNQTEAQTAIRTAKELVDEIAKMIGSLDPQKSIIE